MNSANMNFVFMALLGMAFYVMGITFLSDALYHSDTPENPGYEIEVAEADTPSTAGEPAPPPYDPIAPVLASASVDKGADVSKKKCSACHNFVEGGKNKVGPGLYGVLNRAIAGVEGFGYSSALTTYGEGKVWTYEELNGFLFRPRAHVKGTSMGFAGIKKTAERADIIAYLRSLSADPAPLPGS
ncbi:MAG: cytochrome c family protein [Pseudomonadota bacterium]